MYIRELTARARRCEPARCSRAITTGCYFFFVCARSDAATAFIALDDFGLERIFAAFDATLRDVCLVFAIIPPCMTTSVNPEGCQPVAGG